MLKDFERTLYEALLIAFGKALAKHNTLAQGAVLREAGKEIIDHLNQNGLAFEERGDQSDLARLAWLFTKNGFAESLDIAPLPNGHNYIWRNLHCRRTYRRLHEASDSPFLACPLNVCLFYIADKQDKTMRLHSEHFHPDGNTVESHYEVVDRFPATGNATEVPATDNAKLPKPAEKNACELEQALAEIRSLRGILPICSSCKKIRDNEGFWHAVEVYLRTHTNANFSHGYCPDCESDFMNEIEDTFGPAVPF